MEKKGKTPRDDLRERKRRLEAMSKEEWQEAILNFWRWFEKVRSWDEAHKTNRIRPSQD